MDKEVILLLLQTIKTKEYIGVSSIEAICYTINEGLINRTPSGNFTLSQKGEEFLSQNLELDSL